MTPAQEMEVMVDMEYVSADRSELVPQYRAFPKRTSVQPAAGSPIGPFHGLLSGEGPHADGWHKEETQVGDH